MTSQVLTNAKGDKEMLFSPDLPDEHFTRYSRLPHLLCVTMQMLQHPSTSASCQRPVLHCSAHLLHRMVRRSVLAQTMSRSEETAWAKQIARLKRTQIKIAAGQVSNSGTADLGGQSLCWCCCSATTNGSLRPHLKPVLLSLLGPLLSHGTITHSRAAASSGIGVTLSSLPAACGFQHGMCAC